MEFRILGPLEVRNASGAVALGGVKPRAILAILLLHANDPVSAERLALALWGEDAPRAAVKTVQVNVSRLRKALDEPDAIATIPAGYRLRVRPGELDAARFEQLSEEGRRALAAGQAESAALVLREALALWRGPPLAELATEPFAQAEIARLEEQRLSVVEARVEADLVAGRHAQLMGELQRLVAAHPTREHLAGQLMLALYRCERQADALETYRAARRRLVEEIGVEPGPELRQLHEAILRQDAELEPAPTRAELPPQLDSASAPPLVGRDWELAWLWQRWERVGSGRGGVVGAIGASGIGKTRLAAELATELHKRGAAVLYIGQPESAVAVRAALSRAGDATSPTLVVIDDADVAGPDVLAEFRAFARAVANVPMLVLATAKDREPLRSLDAVDARTLEPLDVEAVRLIARDYAPSHLADDIPAQWLREASGGIPRRVHEVAGQWARREAARRVGAAAGRAAADRAQLRSTEAELADDVVELQETRERAALVEDDEQPPTCPFKGLASFDTADAPYFFGRERLVSELVARLIGAPLLAIVGASGSGKSSVLRAGLLPALAGGVLPASANWEQILIRPGDHPLRELETALSRVGRERPIVLAVDQFEETFTACGDEAERAAFIAKLAQADSRPHASRTVVLCLRADFYGRCAAYPVLSALLAANHVLVGPMRRDELRRAIEHPARRVGLTVESSLTEALVEEVIDEPGGLPLLSTALLELWQKRDGRRLRLADYERTGGVRGAVARLAEDAFSRFDPSQRDIARSVLLRLVAVGDEDTVERRRVSLEELDAEGREEVARVVASLIDRRLLTVSAGTVEIAHEALIREWPRFRAWIEDDFEGVRIHRKLSAAAREWDALKHDEGALYRSVQLDEALDWKARSDVPLNQLEREFLAASEARRRGERAAGRRRRGFAFAAVTTVLVAAIGVVVAVIFAQRERDIAASRDLAVKATSLLAADPALGLAVAFEAMRHHNTPQAQSAVRQATFAHRGTALVRAHEGYVLDAALSRDGQRLVTSGEDGRVRVWDVASGRPVGSSDGDQSLNAASLSSDGSQLAIATIDGDVALAPVAGGPRRVVLRFAGDGRARSVAFTPDGNRLVVVTQGGVVGVIALDSRPARLETLATHAERAVGRLSPRGDRVVSAGEDGLAQITDLAGGAPPLPLKHPVALYDADFSADGAHVATAGDDGFVRVWDARDGRLLKRVSVADGPLMSARFGPDGRVVAGDLNGVVHVVDMRAGQVVGRLVGHAGPVYDALFARSGRAVMSVGEDGTLRAWTPLAARAFATGGQAVGLSASPDGRHAVAGYEDGAVRIINLERGGLTELPGFGNLSEAYYSPNGAFIASTSYDGGVELWNVRRARPIAVSTNDTPKEAVGVDSSGRLMAIAAEGEDPVLQAPDGSGRHELRGHTRAITALVFSPDGKHLVSASEDKTVRIWSTLDGRLEHVLRGHDKAVYHADYSGDGSRIVSADSDGTVRTWTASGEPLSALYGHEGTVNTAALDREGERVVSAGLDGTIRVWDALGGQALAIVHRFDGAALAASFGAGGKAVVVLGGDGALLSIPCEVCVSYADVTRLAGTRLARRLTAAERDRLLADGR